nr:MAG: hypothetical protein [Bacteriophage sp.]
MGTISDKLMRIINTKEDIRQALISKGYDVPASIPFKEYAKMISDLPCKVDDFPQLPGDVTRWHFGGLTNEMMAAMDDPRIEDADHKGRFLSFKNFAWKGMSGVNGYKFDFLLNEWATSNDQISEKYSYKIVINNKQNSVQLINNSGHIKITLKITGIEINKSIFRVYDNAGMEHKQDYTKDGIYEIDYTANEGANKIYFYVVGGNTGQLENPITIEQLPLYPGFILGDGVDDFAVTEKELNFEDTYTVYTAFIPFQNNPTRNMILCGADSKKTFSMQYSSLVYVSFIAGNNYYINADFVNGLNLFACKRNGNNICIKNLLTNKVVTGTCGDWVENAGLYYLWKNATYASFARAGIAGQIIDNGHFTTDEEDENILNWHKKQYPWLFPDQAWTVTGKTNEDEDRATIANITGNGNDLVLSNFGFAEGSGYGLYGENYNGGRWVKSTDRADITWTSYSVNVTSVKIASTQLYYQSYPEQPSFTVPSYKIKVYGLKDGQTLSYKQATSEGQQIYKISEDGIYTLPSFPFKANGDWYGFTLNKVQETCDITIEQIPEYEGYLVTDGVDDKIVSSVFGMGKDFTIVGDWKFIDNKKSGTGLVKGSSFYIYNTMIGLDLYINSGSVTNSFDGIKSINAACSDGRVYDPNWDEILANTGNVVGSGGALEVSSSGGRFGRIAFKNLAIYPRILSKDDCIKAYNYLQTLKAK